MRFLIALALLLSQSAPIGREIRIVFVQPAGETFTAEEQTRAGETVEAALGWWAALSPITTTLAISAAEAITVEEEINDPPWWITRYFEPSPYVTIAILDNSESGAPLWGGGYAGANTAYDVVLITSTTTDLPNATAALLAHELGHVLYDLPDLYTGGCQHTDIMCNPVTAFNERIIGCESRAVIGAPCRHRYLAVIYR
jgi:hypothetical protein